MRLPLVLTALTLQLTASPAVAQQKWPFEFDVALSDDPDAVQDKLDSYSVSLPPLPVASMSTIEVGPVTLWFVPEIAAMLERAVSAGDEPMDWPWDAALCASHASFVVPDLQPAPTPGCQAAEGEIREVVTDRSGCKLVEFPELYVRSFPSPPVVDASVTSNLEGMVGLAAEALSHTTNPPVGLLADDFIPRLRVVLSKVRHDQLVALLADDRNAYLTAIATATDNADCFEASAVASLLQDLDALAAELDAAEAYLVQLEAEGEAETANELIRLGAHSRARKPLPFPSLTWADRELIGMWIGGTYWRMRGGGLIPLDGTQTARIEFFLRPFTFLGDLGGGQDGQDAAFPMYLNLMIFGWSDWQDMGNSAGSEDAYNDLVSMTDRGHTQVASSVDMLTDRGYGTSALLTGGLQMGPCYWMGYGPLSDFHYGGDLTGQPPYSNFVAYQTEVGEFCTGAALGLGFVRSLLEGYATGLPPTCIIDCENRECGDDGCAGSCGTCDAEMTCNDGHCQAPGSCAEKECGDDGQGGSCGECAADEECVAGRCIAWDAGVSTADAGDDPAPNDATDAWAPGADSDPAGCGCRSTSPRGDPAMVLLIVVVACCCCPAGNSRRRR